MMECKLKEKGIYKIINNINGKIYVGSTINFKERCNSHLKDLQRNQHSSPILQNSWNKYGEECFSFVIIKRISSNKRLIKCEQLWMDILNPEFNCCRIAGSPLGVKRSLKTRKKVSNALKKFFKEYGNSFKGKKHTLESRINMSNAHKGKFLKDIHKFNCPCSFCKASRGELSGKNSHRYGIKHTPEAIKKIRKASFKQIHIKGWKMNEESKALIREKRKLQNPPNLGKRKSPEWIEKQRISLLAYYKRKGENSK